MNKNLLIPLILASSTTLGTASDRVELTTTMLRNPALESVLFDEPGDGRIWALGQTYKASFGAEGTTYIPAFGSQAPQNFPIRFQFAALEVAGEPVPFEALAQPKHEGTRVAFARGILEERYDLGLESMEQSFVIDTRQLSGSLVLRMVVDTELLGQFDDQGIVFSNQFGSVNYSRAFAIQEDGAKIALETTLDGAELEIRVPADMVKASDGQLVIDPILTTYALQSQSTVDEINPDVAAGTYSQRCTAVERVFSATDHDIIAYLQQYPLIIDVTVTDWRVPAVAFNRNFDRWMVAAQAELASGKFEIYGRSVNANLTTGGQFSMTPWAGDYRNPTMGGDLNAELGTKFLMVCERDCPTCASPQCSLIGVHITGSSTVDSSFYAACATAGSGDVLKRPALSKSNGGGPAGERYWGLAYEYSTGILLDDNDLWFRRIPYGGPGGESPLLVDGTSAFTTFASISSPVGPGIGKVLISYTYTASFGSEPTIRGSLVDMGIPSSSSSTEVLDTKDLVMLVGAPLDYIQSSSSVDSDGRDFAVAWCERPLNGSDRQISISTISLLNNKLAGAGQPDILPADLDLAAPVICSLPDMSSPVAQAGLGQYGLVWQRATATSPIYCLFGVYDAEPFTSFCNPGFDGVMSCPCGNAPSALGRGCNNWNNTGGASIDAIGSTVYDTVTLLAEGMRPNATAIVLQGSTTSSVGIAFGDGVRCASGQLLRLAVKSTTAGGQLSYPSAGEVSIRSRNVALGSPIPYGARRVYQVYYRDPLSSGCTATFNVTNALQAQW